VGFQRLDGSNLQAGSFAAESVADAARRLADLSKELERIDSTT